MGINLREEGERLRQSASAMAGPIDGVVSAARPFDIRAYRVTNPQLFGKSIKEIEALPKQIRAYIVRVRHGDKVVEPNPDTIISENDVVAVITRHEIHVSHGERIGPEIGDLELLDMPVEALDVIVTDAMFDGKSLAELASSDLARGVFLSRLTRSGVPMPILPDTVLDRGDVLRLVGTVIEVERAAKLIGYPDRPTAATDMVFVGLGIFLGGLIGFLSVDVLGIPLTLTASGGALISGLAFGWLRSAYPFFGRIPEAAIWIFDTVGLCVFISVVGLNAGPSFISGLQTTGLSLVFVGLVSSLTPHTLAILFGAYVLRMNPLVVLGACAGAGTITAALHAIQDEAQSNYPALGYTVPYAIGNILLTAWGPVLVALMSIR